MKLSTFLFGIASLLLGFGAEEARIESASVIHMVALRNVLTHTIINKLQFI